MALQVGEVGMEDLDGATFGEQRMPFGDAEQSQDLFCGGVLAKTLLGVEREFLDLVALHREA